MQKYENANFEKSKKPSQHLGSQLSRKCGRKPSVISPTPTWSLLALHPFHLRNTISRNTKYREKCKNMKRQISPTPTWFLLLALHPFHLRNTISRNMKYREKCKNMKRQIPPTPTWFLLALHPFSCFRNEKRENHFYSPQIVLVKLVSPKLSKM